MKSIAPTERTKVQRLPQRGEYDRETIYAILDEAFVCHIGFVIDGEPVMIPTGYARDGDRLIVHGSQASRLMRNLAEGVPVCVTVTILDGLVLARSAFHHSMNYRSAVIFGRAHCIESAEEKTEALRLLSEHIVPGRWDDVRQPTPDELKVTLVLSLSLAEASAKIRRGPPVDDRDDYDLAVWAGEVPLETIARAPIADPQLKSPAEVPAYARNYRRPKKS